MITIPLWWAIITDACAAIVGGLVLALLAWLVLGILAYVAAIRMGGPIVRRGKAPGSYK